MDGFAAFIHEQSLALIGLAVFASLLLARELGGWAHRRVAGPIDDPDDEAADKGYILSGVLGLLALLIAFTFSLSVDRYESRLRIVVAEANAIGTAEMRVQLLPSPGGERPKRMLRDYARTRLDYGLSGSE